MRFTSDQEALVQLAASGASLLEGLSLPEAKSAASAVRSSLAQLSEVSALEGLRAWKAALFSDEAPLALLSRSLKDRTLEEKRTLGQAVQSVRKPLLELFSLLEAQFEEARLLLQAQSEMQDASLPALEVLSLGGVHPIQSLTLELKALFGSLGFEIADGLEMDTPWFSFDALNVPEDHPARAESDTFYLENGRLLRPHTSNVQIHFTLECKPQIPFAVASFGRVYRRDLDATHSPMFHQMEALVVGEDIHMGHLRFTIESMLKALFGSLSVRFRPSFFPFTEPSMEADISCLFCKGSGCSVCKGSGYLEVLGSGMVHPHVLKEMGFDPSKVQGFAFGAGIERLLMLREGVSDLRLFYENHPHFLSQFQSRRLGEGS